MWCMDTAGLRDYEHERGYLAVRVKSLRPNYVLISLFSFEEDLFFFNVPWLTLLTSSLRVVYHSVRISTHLRPEFRYSPSTTALLRNRTWYTRTYTDTARLCDLDHTYDMAHGVRLPAPN
jgi:hypothetical protein